MSKFTVEPTVSGNSFNEARIVRLEEQVKTMETKLLNSFVLGRLRFDRVVPTSSADVKAPDKLYDVVRDSNFEYVLINNAGTLAWRRITLSSF